MPGRWNWPGPPKSGTTHRLDPTKVVEAARQLADDVDRHLPGTTLAGLARELVTVAESAIARAERAARPILPIRVASAAAAGLVLAGLAMLARQVHPRWEFGTIGEAFGTINGGVNLIVLFAGILWTCVTFESRLKRKASLGAIGELREFIHVIDITQLYYTPDLYHSRPEDGTPRLAIDETYLLYCTRMLGVIGNLAPLYTRGVTGDSILRAASEVEMLAIATTTKQMTKAQAVRAIGRDRNHHDGDAR